MSVPGSSAPHRRDRALRQVRVLRWGIGLGAAGLTAACSVVAANAFKGHDGTSLEAVRTPAHHGRRLRVPGPERIPAIGNDPAPLAPPSAPPAAAPSQPPPAPAPETVSGGS
jgi:hypothetical protein